MGELVPIRYGRMLVSPFTFYRGAALLMAADLAATPQSGVTVQLCGDAHLSNFGLFGTPERRLLFDINDFDETLPGPWEWDVKRLATSFEVMGRYRGFSKSDRRDVTMACAREYRERLRQAAAMRTLEAWYEHLEAGSLLHEVAQEVRDGRLTKKEEKTVKNHLAKALTRDSVRVLTRRAEKSADGLRIVAEPPAHRAHRGPGRPGHGVGEDRRDDQGAAGLVSHDAERRAPSDRGVPLRARGPQGGRGGQRWDALLHPAAARTRRRRPPLPPGQRGPGLGPRTLRRPQRLHPPRSARGRRTAPHAGRQRHLLGVAADQGPRRRHT